MSKQEFPTGTTNHETKDAESVTRLNHNFIPVSEILDTESRANILMKVVNKITGTSDMPTAEIMEERKKFRKSCFDLLFKARMEGLRLCLQYKDGSYNIENLSNDDYKNLDKTDFIDNENCKYRGDGDLIIFSFVS